MADFNHAPLTWNGGALWSSGLECWLGLAIGRSPSGFDSCCGNLQLALYSGYINILFFILTHQNHPGRRGEFDGFLKSKIFPTKPNNAKCSHDGCGG